MQEGIGRGGYRALAIVFFAVGALGLVAAAVALGPSGFFDWLGLALAAVALAGLCGLALASLGAPALGARRGEPEPMGGSVSLPTPEPPIDADPNADLGVEYSDAQPVPIPDEHLLGSEPERFTPPPRIQPPPVPITQPRRVPEAKGGWPERPGPSGATRRQVLERDLPRDPGPEIEIEGPRSARREPPIVMARTVASAEATGIPEGSGVGKCGNCGVLLLAPKKRPIRLQCPRCERVHTLG